MPQVSAETRTPLGKLHYKARASTYEIYYFHYIANVVEDIVHYFIPSPGQRNIREILL